MQLQFALRGSFTSVSEFECDVSVEGGVDPCGQERQEFSFTLYDFDGHGKITKDVSDTGLSTRSPARSRRRSPSRGERGRLLSDIAGLVTTIYDTLGSSIKVPHYGSKTIKVNMTVSPDQRQKAAAAAAAASSAPPPHRVKFKRDLNVTIQESRRPGGRRRRHEEPPPPPPPRCRPSNSCSSASEEAAADASEEEEDDDDEAPLPESHHSTPRATPRDSSLKCLGELMREGCVCSSGRSRARRYQQHAPPRHKQQAGEGAGAPVLLRHRSKKPRSSSLQREELLQIIQANMEKNNLSFQTSRKPCMERSEPRHPPTSRTRHKLHYLSMGDYPDPRYLDLAGMDPHGLDYRVYNLPSCRSRGHHRSRSHDLSGAFRYHLLDPHHSYIEHHARSKSHEAEFGYEHRYERKFPSVVGHSSSPHHLKHRNREQDQARAMAQVVRWLEQEFSSSLNTADKLNTKNTSGGTKSPPVTPAKAPSQPHSPGTPKRQEAPTSPTSSSVERHEHHHVHEHIHHHYHHYQETPVLV
ncbi:hypothetical protein PR048_014519 [Dryococelus australis]|uniref:Protein naked cuticle homolog n=1 Tax=Dryococelus australis TaxID=614101 RepID=A0ABQ9HEG1_9NEOP|nr:hypothetical protein PR048_014519 [Dryococelus australis]